jgi:hypothetical protein
MTALVCHSDSADFAGGWEAGEKAALGQRTRTLAAC